MRFYIFGLLFGITFAEVIELTTNNFKGFLSENEYVLVEFYAPWCGHCKSLAPEYERASNMLDTVVLAKVDGTTETSLSEEFNIEAFPTIILFKGGEKVEEYDSRRTADAIVIWCTERIGESFITTTENELDDVKEKAFKLTKAAIVLYAPSQSDELRLFEKVSAQKRSYGMYIHVESPMISLKVFHQEEGLTGFIESLTDEAQVNSFLYKESFPLFAEVNARTYPRYIAENPLNFNLGWICLSAKNKAKNLEKLGPAIREVAKELRGKYYFIHIEIDAFRQHSQEYLGCSNDPSIVLHVELHKKALRYVRIIDDGEDFGSQNIKEFINRVEKGEVKPFLRGQPVPSPNNKPVREVVSSTFDEEIFRADKDVLLEVYSPECNFCRQFAPVYERLASLVKVQEAGNDLVIAKMDGTENESAYDDFQWEGFPTLFYVAAGQTKPKVLDISRNLKTLVEYLRSSSKLESVRKLEILSGPLDFKEVRNLVESPGALDQMVVRQIKELLDEHDKNMELLDEEVEEFEGIPEDSLEDEDWDNEL